MHGLSQAEHIVHSIWYLLTAGELEVTGDVSVGKIMRRVRRESVRMWVFSISGKMSGRTENSRRSMGGRVMSDEVVDWDCLLSLTLHQYFFLTKKIK